MKLARLTTMLAVAATFTVAPQPAVASCTGQPAVSAHAFTGTVLYTRHGGRMARVLTGRSHLVTVTGTTNPDVVTSVDRSYIAGARYEFHPLNDRPPYMDNACTATHRL